MRRLLFLFAIMAVLLCSCAEEPCCTAMHIVTVGYDFYGTGNQLNGPVNDAVQIGYAMQARALESGYSCDVQYLVGDKLTSIKHKPSTYVSPTYDNLESALSSLAATAQETDITVLFMSSHGSDEDDGYIVLKSGSSRYRYDYVEYALLADLMSEIPGYKVIMLDCCYSGLAVEQTGVSSNSYYGGSTPVFGSNVEVTPRLWVLSASMPDTSSYDGCFGHGYFTSAVLACLGWDYEYDTGFDSQCRLPLTLFDIASYVYRNDGKKEQTPMLTGSSDDLVLFT